MVIPVPVRTVYWLRHELHDQRRAGHADAQCCVHRLGRYRSGGGAERRSQQHGQGQMGQTAFADVHTRRLMIQPHLILLLR
jgi:hypothetical protein